MALIWHPDFCPTRPGCALEVDQGQNNVLAVLRWCARHQALRDGGLTDAEVFAAIRATSRAKEAARWAMKVELMNRGLMDKEHPGLPFVVDPDGAIRIQSGRSGALRTTLRTRAAEAVATRENPPGRAAVIVD